ncbi:hypothetical protein [Pectobacterium carotovorum]|uniref:hypothetical protein n=1 Tax=Pectobacterium brasiliense TaxID=180957 RepID=UPI001F3623DD|nr:hypothetical protein [Pectobacterium carotovorum]
MYNIAFLQWGAGVALLITAIYSGVLQLISRWQGYLPIIALILVSGLSHYLYLEGVILFDIHQESVFLSVSGAISTVIIFYHLQHQGASGHTNIGGTSHASAEDTPLCTSGFFTHRLPPTALSPSIFLGVVGTPGRSAYFGMNKIAKPKAGEMQVVSAASGGVGSVVGQLGKQAGCHGERAVKISREHY